MQRTPEINNIARIGVIVLTGFLGSGKTTFLREALKGPAWAETAVIVNEVGSVGLDHVLLTSAGGSVGLIENGCICCSVNTSLVATLEDLFWSRLHRKVPWFRRVVIETTGLADPRPIIEALHTEGLVSERFRHAMTLVCVDAEQGLAQLHRHPEARGQAIAADRILLTRSDVAEADAIASTSRELQRLNPLAVLVEASMGRLAEGASLDPDEPMARADAITPGDIDEPPLDFGHVPMGHGPVFHQRIGTFTIRIDKAPAREQSRTALEDLARSHGKEGRLLRAKGILSFHDDDDAAERTVVQVVTDRLYPFEPLRSADIEEQGFLVFIGEGLTRRAMEQALRDRGFVVSAEPGQQA